MLQEYDACEQPGEKGAFFYSVRKKGLTSMLSTWVNLVSDATISDGKKDTIDELNIQLKMIFSLFLMSGLFNHPPGSDSWLNLEDPDKRDFFIHQAIEMLVNR